jgi:hypothetical protein
MKETHLNSHESLVKDLLCRAGIPVNGPTPWDIQVHDDRVYRRVCRELLFDNIDDPAEKCRNRHCGSGGKSP